MEKAALQEEIDLSSVTYPNISDRGTLALITLAIHCSYVSLIIHLLEEIFHITSHI